MSSDKFLIAQAQEVRRMAKQGYCIKEIQERIGFKKKRLIEILSLHYTEANKNRILDMINSNKGKIREDNKKEVIVIDTSFLISSKLEDLEKFLIENRNSVIPGPVLAELPTNSNDERINFTSRRIQTILFELDIKIEVADSTIILDPTWVKNNDYYILTVCSKFKNQGYVTKLLSFDKQMILKARGLGIEIHPMPFPQDNVKHCNSYDKDQGEVKLKETRYVQKSERDIKEIKENTVKKELASDESLEALKNKFSNSHSTATERVHTHKKQTAVYNFEKPKIAEDTTIDQSKLEIVKVENSFRLIDNSNIDIYMGILKIPITSCGKSKVQQGDNKSLYYDLDITDKIMVFTKVSNRSIEMEIGDIDENANFIIKSTQLLQEGNMKKINKKYHESIKEAFIKLLKIKLKKVS